MNRKEPLFRVVKKDSVSRWKVALAYLIAIAAALLIGALLLSVMKVDALDFYKKIVTLGIPGSKYPFRSVEGFIRLFVPLLIVSLALSLAFRMRFWNVGGEGQFIIGAICAGAAAFLAGDALPGPVMILVMAVCGALGGGLYGSIASALKVKYGTNETLMTLMLNYIALYLIRFFGETQGEWNIFLSAESVRPRFDTFPGSAQMPTIPIGPFSLNITLIIALLLCVLIYIYLNYTKQGYEIAVVGDSPNTARYAGMKVGKVVIRTVFLSAALVGMAGAFYVSSAGALSTSVTNDVGWTGVIVAWLAKLSTVGILVTSVLITVLQYGCQVASASYSNIDSNFANLLQGIILFAVLMADFTSRYQLVWRNKRQEVSK